VDIVPFVDLAAHHAPLRSEIQAAVEKVLLHGKYILGPEVEAFEQGFAKMVGAKHAIGVGTGLDALRLAFEAAGVRAGDYILAIDREIQDELQQMAPNPEALKMALKGIVKDRTGFVSMLQAPDGKTYFARVGQRCYDGVITAMDQATVTFRQEVQDPLSPVKTRDVKKSLYTFEEARQ